MILSDDSASLKVQNEKTRMAADCVFHNLIKFGSGFGNELG